MTSSSISPGWVAPLEDHYCLDNGRPAIHPEVMVRALLICSLYNISSFTRLNSAIAENIPYRCFCFLTIDDPVFDHSTISYFIERIGRDGFAGIFNGLNEELLRLGLLSPGMYADTCLVNDITADPADPEAEGARMTRTLDDFGVFPDSCVYCKGQRYIASEFGRYYEAIGRHSTPNPIFRRTKLLNLVHHASAQSDMLSPCGLRDFSEEELLALGVMVPDSPKEGRLAYKGAMMSFTHAVRLTDKLLDSASEGAAAHGVDEKWIADAPGVLVQPGEIGSITRLL